MALENQAALLADSVLVIVVKIRRQSNISKRHWSA